jgi:hypothetical protein
MANTIAIFQTSKLVMAEKSGNVLTQSIDEQGNLIGVNNTTQEVTLAEKDIIDVTDNQNIVVRE